MMKHMQMIWTVAMLIFVLACISGCSKKEKEITAEELLGGVQFSTEDPMKVSAQAEVSAEIENVSGAAVSVPIDNSINITINANLENTEKTAHIIGNNMVNGKTNDFEAYLAKTETGYGYYTRIGQDEWAYSAVQKDDFMLPSVSAELLKEAEVKETKTGYELTGQVNLSNMIKENQTVGSVFSFSDFVSAYDMDFEKMNMDVQMFFNKNRQFTSIAIMAGDNMKEEFHKLLNGKCNLKITADFDLSGDIQVQIPGEVQNKAFADAALDEDENLLKTNDIRAETSEELAALLGLKYKELEDEEKLLIGNMLYYLGGNERVKAACKNWDMLPESDKRALAAIMKHQYVSPDALIMFGANESELNALAEDNAL